MFQVIFYSFTYSDKNVFQNLNNSPPSISSIVSSITVEKLFSVSSVCMYRKQILSNVSSRDPGSSRLPRRFLPDLVSTGLITYRRVDRRLTMFTSIEVQNCKLGRPEVEDRSHASGNASLTANNSDSRISLPFYRNFSNE